MAKHSKRPEGDAMRAIRFVLVTIGALGAGYLIAVFLYAVVVPRIVDP